MDNGTTMEELLRKLAESERKRRELEEQLEEQKKEMRAERRVKNFRRTCTTVLLTTSSTNGSQFLRSLGKIHRKSPPVYSRSIWTSLWYHALDIRGL